MIAETQRVWAVLAIAYVMLVLAIDTLAAQNVNFLIAWEAVHWQAKDIYRLLKPPLESWGVSAASLAWLRADAWQAFDFFKFTFWLLLPLLFCISRIDWGWLGAARMQTNDWRGLMLIAVAGAAAMWLIPSVPELSRLYPSLSFLPVDAKLAYLQIQLCWIISWWLGWEFMHRYLLLRAGLTISLRWGWLIVPAVEGIYHLQKPLLEAGGMVVLSVLLTLWTLRRRTLLPALMAHLVIELELLAYQLW